MNNRVRGILIVLACIAGYCIASIAMQKFTWWGFLAFSVVGIGAGFFITFIKEIGKQNN